MLIKSKTVLSPTLRKILTAISQGKKLTYRLIRDEFFFDLEGFGTVAPEHVVWMRQKKIINIDKDSFFRSGFYNYNPLNEMNDKIMRGEI